MPDAARSYARRVTYRSPQPYWPGVRLDAEDDEPGLIETRHGRTRVLWGLYLRDLPVVFAAARSEPCWR